MKVGDLVKTVLGSDRELTGMILKIEMVETGEVMVTVLTDKGERQWFRKRCRVISEIR